jgi:uroporphyrinogen-III synthase
MKRILYLGLDPPPESQDVKYIHFPIIEIVPTQINTREIQQTFQQLPSYTHFLFTSQSAVRIFFDFLPHFKRSIGEIRNKTIYATGRKTASFLKESSIEKVEIPDEETAEGIVQMLSTKSFVNSWIFWPHSSLSRPILSNYFNERNIRYTECVLYHTKTAQIDLPFPGLENIDEIFFTSPSTVDAYMELFGKLPSDKTLTAIGPITSRKLSSVQKL